MATTFKRIIKIASYLLISLLFLVITGFLLFYFGFLSNFSSVEFNKNKLSYKNSAISVFNIENKNLNQNNENETNIDALDMPQKVLDAFISVEDKTFYTHKGVNYKRMLKATLKNLTSKSFKEGASTISQQVIKNTHLTSEKTFKRKINELLLTQKLEKNLSKTEILTAYLNAIYFGGGAFGINNASQRYYSKPATELTLCEGATLAGIIKSPNKYSPITHPEECLKRRNFVLKCMLENKKISKEEYNSAIAEPISLNINSNFLGNNNYYSATIAEACHILGISEKDLLLKQYKIYTYQNPQLQDIVDSELENYKNYCDVENVNALMLSVNNKTGGINAFSGKSNYDLLSLYRQPASVFKPIISYAPALEHNIISPITPILDEKININGYEPKNYNNVYHGFISAKSALAKSLNIPSIRLLNYVGIEKAKSFANKLNISFNENDNGYALALGGLTKGVKFKELTNCYQCFANNGKYIDIGFIKEIRTSDNKIIYKHNELGKQVMKQSTAYLLNTMLRESVETGTCKKLNLANCKNICSKTGTVGVANSVIGENSDVYNLSYTPQNTLCCWFGSTNNNYLLPKKITGSNAPTFMAQSFYKKAKLSSENFEKPEDVVNLNINALEYNNNQKIMLASQDTPERYVINCPFYVNNTPKETSTIFCDIPDFNINVTKNNNTVNISFKAVNYLEYDVIRKDDDNITILSKITNKNEIINISDNTLTSGNIYTYYVVARYNSKINYSSFQENKSKKSNEVKILLTQNNPPF